MDLDMDMDIDTPGPSGSSNQTKKKAQSKKGSSAFTIKTPSEQGPLLHSYYRFGIELETGEAHKSPKLLLNGSKNVYVQITISSDAEKTGVKLEFDKPINFDPIYVLLNVGDEYDHDKCGEFSVVHRFAPIKLTLTKEDEGKVYVSEPADLGDAGYCQFCNRHYYCCCKRGSSNYTGPSRVYDAIIMYKFDEQSADPLETYFNNKEYTDLIITVNKTSFNVHRAIIAAKSPVLKKMIDDDMSARKMGKIIIKGEDTPTVEQVLRYIYLGKSALPKKLNNIFLFAHNYQIKDLKEVCKRYMLNNLSMENIIDIFKLIFKYDIDDAKDSVSKFVTSNESTLSKHVDFINCLKEVMSPTNIDYVLKLVIKHKMHIADDVKAFINDHKEVYNNEKFKALIKKNQKWLKG